MAVKTLYDVLIIGGSYAGLSAAMSLGRALRRVLIIDSKTPCNRFTPHSHNFLTQDGKPPGEIAALAAQQVGQYDTVEWYHGTAVGAWQIDGAFEVETGSGDRYSASRILFATGLTDQVPGAEGFAACWGISILHCPYCHGYEVRSLPTGVIGNGETGFDLVRLISNWTDKLTLFTNGPSTLTGEQAAQLHQRQIGVVEIPIRKVEHEEGKVKAVVLESGARVALDVIYARFPVEQQCALPMQLGCDLNEQGLIRVDGLQKTSVPGVYAAGDNSGFARSVAMAVAAGSMAGAAINRELIEEAFGNSKPVPSRGTRSEIDHHNEPATHE